MTIQTEKPLRDQVHETGALEEILERLRVGEELALTDLNHFAKENPTYPDPWAHLAWNLYCQGRFVDAEQAALHLLTILPESPDVYRLLSRIHFNVGDKKNSLQYMQQSLNFAQEPFFYRLDYIDTLLHFRQPYRALAEYFRLLREQSPMRSVPSKLGQRIFAEVALNLLSRLIFIPALRDRIFYRIYDHFIQKKQFGKAYLLAKCPTSNPEESGKRAEQAADSIYNKREFLFPDFENEIAWRRIALDSNRSQAAEKLARVLLHAGQAVPALEILQGQESLSALGQEMLAHTFGVLREYEKAIALYRQLGERDPIHFTNAGITALAKKNAMQAIQSFAQARQHLPDHPLAVFLHDATAKREQGFCRDADELDNLLQDLAQRHQWHKRISEKRNDWMTVAESLLSQHKYQRIDCPNCGSGEFIPTYLDPVVSWVRGRCNDCGLLYTNPQIMPKFIPELYTNEASQGSNLQRFFRQTLEELLSQPKEEAGKMFERKERWWLPEFSLPAFEAERGPQRRMLDIGCSVGSTMYQYHCRGWQVSGIDLDPHAVEIAKSLGLDAKLITFEDASIPGDHFDFITMMDVIEHVPDHKPLLEKIYRIMKPGGILKIKTPCPETVIHYTYGPQWVSSDTHLLYFSRRVLLQALRQAGFNILATRTYLEANKISHTYTHWREQNITPLFDQLVIDWNIGDTITVLAQK